MQKFCGVNMFFQRRKMEIGFEKSGNGALCLKECTPVWIGGADEVLSFFS